MDDGVDQTGSVTQQQRGGRRGYVLLPAGTFIAGLLLGGALVWVTQPDEGEGSSEPAESPAPSLGASPPSSAPPDAIEVPRACLRAAEAAEQLVGLARDAVSALGDLDAAALQDVVNRMQALDERVRADVRECRQPDAP